MHICLRCACNSFASLDKMRASNAICWCAEKQHLCISVCNRTSAWTLLMQETFMPQPTEDCTATGPSAACSGSAGACTMVADILQTTALLTGCIVRAAIFFAWAQAFKLQDLLKSNRRTFCYISHRQCSTSLVDQTLRMPVLQNCNCNFAQLTTHQRWIFFGRKALCAFDC